MPKKALPPFKRKFGEEEGQISDPPRATKVPRRGDLPSPIVAKTVKIPRDQAGFAERNDPMEREVFERRVSPESRGRVRSLKRLAGNYEGCKFAYHCIPPMHYSSSAVPLITNLPDPTMGVMLSEDNALAVAQAVATTCQSDLDYYVVPERNPLDQAGFAERNDPMEREVFERRVSPESRGRARSLKRLAGNYEGCKYSYHCMPPMHYSSGVVPRITNLPDPTMGVMLSEDNALAAAQAVATTCQSDLDHYVGSKKRYKMDWVFKDLKVNLIRALVAIDAQERMFVDMKKAAYKILRDKKDLEVKNRQLQDEIDGLKSLVNAQKEDLEKVAKEIEADKQELTLLRAQKQEASARVMELETEAEQRRRQEREDLERIRATHFDNWVDEWMATKDGSDWLYESSKGARVMGYWDAVQKAKAQYPEVDVELLMKKLTGCEGVGVDVDGQAYFLPEAKDSADASSSAAGGHTGTITSPREVIADIVGAITGKGTLSLRSGSCYLPHPDKEKTGGEDAHFICEEKRIIGVADGVGGWADVGVDAGEYARGLMSNSVAAIKEKLLGSIDPAKVLEKAHSLTKVRGSSTACIVALSEEGIHAINLGDSGFLIIRDGRMVFRSPAQQFRFNFPYQLESGTAAVVPSSGQVFRVPVAAGDVVVAGTDGLFDNLYNNEICSIVVHGVRTHLEPQVTAQKIAALARERAMDKERQTPFSVAAQHAGLRYHGGKLDDITVVVSYITASDH